ncbi:MAG: MCE family protein [Lentisphaerae bacterium]|jgi:phospholipid/cholesterol/gamma-HCH transport system substrate-binding protein|nr:MCE family protein [Lentisphaerota bacterium]
MAKKFKFRYVNEIVGAFVMLVVLLLLAGVLVAGRAQHWFEPMYDIELQFPPEGSMDLLKGAEVMLLGARVGSVQDISVDDAGNIMGSIRVRGSFMRFVRKDSIALVKKKMVVTGDAYIELTRGTGAELPRSGGSIACEKDTEIMQMLEEALERLEKEAEHTLGLVNRAIEEYTTLAGAMNDPAGNLQQMLASANGLIEDLRSGPGLPAKILNDPGMAQEVEGLLGQVQELMTKVNAMASDLQAVSASLPELVSTVADEVDDLPVVVGEAQTLMRETTVLMEGLQRHWFLRKYMESDDAMLAEEVLY